LPISVMMKDMLMNYDTMSGGKGGVPGWKGAGIVYDRAWMILEHLRKNGYGVGRHPIYKEMKRVEEDMAAMIAALEQGHEITVRNAVQRNIRFYRAAIGGDKSLMELVFGACLAVPLPARDGGIAACSAR
jgi:hypothetical protein